MDTALTPLLAASVTFIGTHFAMSHPLRRPMVSVLGEKGFQGVYSLVSIAVVVWMYFAFKAAPAGTPLWTGFDDASWAAGSAVALLALVFHAGSFVGNPAMAMPGAEKAACAKPGGLFRVTRHPMMWGFVMLGLAHMIAAPTARSLVIAVTIIVLALLGAHLQDRKKRELMGEAWVIWEQHTSYWPRLGGLLRAGWMPWMIGILLWLGLSWLHQPAGGIAAGIWRWV